ncbi:HlyD family efflux transporter periplasmic adaptor subunit [Tumidithrix helvetica PCC 7403]|uniref:HlyD family secretion protein n=1 Tax=Tumidithrix helvetica TaxID=3457545 RepID=UPI003CAAC76A
MTKTVDSSKVVVENAPSASPQILKKPPQRRWLWILMGTAAIAGIGIGIWYGSRPKTDRLIQLSGRIEGYETDVSTKGAGRVEEVTVREGTMVKKGQLLVRLSDDEVRAELQAATSQVDAAKQREVSARLQISAAEAQVEDARLNLQQSEGDTQGKVTEADGIVATAQAILEQEQARVGEARALLEQARVDRDRYFNLASQGAETRQRYDLAKTTFNVAEAGLQSRLAAVKAASQAIQIARGKLTQAQTSSLNPNRQETNVSRFRTQLAQAQATLVAAQADVQTAEANRQLIQTRLNNLTVNSPIDGVVTMRSVETGTVVLPSRPLLRIVDLNQVYMRGFIPGGDIGRIWVGGSARVYLDNDPDRQHPLKATIVAIDAKASFTPENVYFQKDRVEQVFGVKLSLEQPNGFAKPGMPADAEIILDRR